MTIEVHLIEGQVHLDIILYHQLDLLRTKKPIIYPRSRDVHGGAVAVGFRKIHRGSGSSFSPRTLKNCMNLVGFQCLQMKHPETESI